jgi:two-component sensor histidine kinase
MLLLWNVRSGVSQAPDNSQELLDAKSRAIGLIYTNPDSAEVLFRKGMHAAKSSGLDSIYFEYCFGYARYAQMRSQFDTALSYTRKAGAVIFGNRYVHREHEYYNLMARYHKYLNHVDSALYYLQVFDAHLESRKKDTYRWLSQQSLALFYLDFPDYPKASYHIEEALKYARIEKSAMHYLYVLYTAMDIYRRQDMLDRVSALNEEYLKFKLGNGEGVLDNTQHAHLILPFVDSSDRVGSIQKYIPVHLRNGDTLSTITSYQALGEVYRSMDKIDEAITAHESALEIAYHQRYPNIRYLSHAYLFDLYDKGQQPAKALFHHKAMTALGDSLRNIEREKIMHDLEVRYATAEKEHQLAAATFDLERAKRRQQLLLMGAFGLMVLISLVFYAYRQKRKANAHLSEKNAMISQALKEKDILLREIHHRVKNNLQMISALLYLHGKSINDPFAQEALLESQNRVQSMAMIHQNLYQTENLLGVGVKNYLDRLLAHLIASYNVESDRIRIRTQIEIDHLDVDTIVPLALIVNELISNSLKYAFQDGRTGEIDVFIGRKEGQIMVSVRDNGVGLPATFSKDVPSSFGYKLINILSERLGAQLSTKTDKGTLVSLTIPVSKAA